MENKTKPAYITHRFNTFLGIYRSPLSGTHWFFAYISRTITFTVKVHISLERSWDGRWHGLVWFPSLKTQKSKHVKSSMCRFPLFNGGKSNELRIKPAYIIHRYNIFKGHIDLRCIWKRFRDISEEPTCSTKRRSIYSWKGIQAVGDIGWFNIEYVLFSIAITAGNGTCEAFDVPFSALLTVENGTDWKLSQPMSLVFSGIYWSPL